MRIKHYILIFVFLAGCLLTTAQDVHFSQFMNAPLMINPACTGNSPYRVRSGMNYRNQWAKVTNSPFVTQSAFADVKLTPKKLKRDWIGAGTYFYNDKAGDGNLKTTKITLLASYNKAFNRTKNFFGGIGFGLGLANRSMDYTKLYFESQWVGYTFDQGQNSNEQLTENSFLYLDMNAGLFLKYAFEEKFEFHFGSSFLHVNRPHDEFTPESNRMGLHTNINAGMSIRITETFLIKPEVLYSFQKEADELLAGTLLAFQMEETFLYAGGWARSDRDIVVAVGLFTSGFRIMGSYDINTSPLQPMTKSRGGFELSVIKSFQLVDNSMGSKFKSKGGVPKFGY